MPARNSLFLSMLDIVEHRFLRNIYLTEESEMTPNVQRNLVNIIVTLHSTIHTTGGNFTVLKLM